MSDLYGIFKMKAIFQGGVELFRGDDNLVQTILNNLTGANFAGRDDEYNGYVSYMSDKFGVKINPSELVIADACGYVVIERSADSTTVINIKIGFATEALAWDGLSSMSRAAGDLEVLSVVDYCGMVERGELVEDLSLNEAQIKNLKSYLKLALGE